MQTFVRSWWHVSDSPGGLIGLTILSAAWNRMRTAKSDGILHAVDVQMSICGQSWWSHPAEDFPENCLHSLLFLIQLRENKPFFYCSLKKKDRRVLQVLPTWMLPQVSPRFTQPADAETWAADISCFVWVPRQLFLPNKRQCLVLKGGKTGQES